MANEVAESRDAREPRFEIYEDESGEWRYRLLAGNGEIVLPNEGHRDPADTLRAIRTLEDVLDQQPNLIIIRGPRK